MDAPLKGYNEGRGAKRILIVEDETIVALSESFMLRKRGYEVDTAGSGEAALAYLAGGGLPDLVLMDIDLGEGMDGTEAASAILETRRLPIVFLTSHSSKEMVDKVRGITRYGYIIKNSGDFVMLSTIEMAFDLFAKEKLIEEKNALLRRAERAARIGYWFVSPGSASIIFSEGSRSILGLDSESCSFEEFERGVLADASSTRARAFRELVDKGKPYDISYRIRRADTGEVVAIRSSGRVSDGAVLGVIQDISEIEGLIGDLRASEARQAITLRSIGDGVISTDTEGRVVELNLMAERLTGWRSDEASGRPISEVFEIVNASTRRRVENPVQKVIETGYIVGLANHTVLIARDGTERHIADSAAPIRDDSGTMLGMVLVFRDISPDYEAQEAIRRNEEIFRTLFADAHTPILLIDPESGAIDEANRASARFYGWSVDALRSMNIADINVLSPQEIAREMRMAAESDRKEFRFIHRLSCGEERLVLVASGPISIGGAKKLLSIVRDASDAQMMEAELVAEKGRSRIIRRDAQHRMKNSAQLISSLIEIQASSLEDEATAGALRDLQNRVNGLGLVYDKLYVRDEEEHVASADYLSSLLDAIESGYVPRAVRLSRRIEEAELEARFAVSLGLIVGELVMNACKYAFPSEAKGSITVAFSRSPGDRLSLVVSDDGIGIDAARRIQGDSAREGTGLSLVRSLVAQEKGDIEIDMEGKGTSIACSFPLNRR